MAKTGKGVARGIAMITQIGISVIVPIFLCVYAGAWLDRKFETGFITIVLLILGILAAFRNIYLMTRSFYAKEKQKEDAQLKYLEELKKASEKQDERKQEARKR